MKTYLINYANAKFENIRKLNTWTGKYIAGFDKVIEYRPEDIDFNFKENNKKILKYERGNGLWLWKPYFCLKTLETMQEGDILFYCDSGAFFIRSISSVLNNMKDDILVFELPLIEKQWTKGNVINELVNQENLRKSILESKQILATFFAVKKTRRTVNFIQTWLKNCCNEELLSPESCICEDDIYIAHREDQSIFSIMCKKEGIIPHKDISQFGKYPEGYKYPNYIFISNNSAEDEVPILILHRKTKFLWKHFTKLVLISVLPKKNLQNYLKPSDVR